MRFDNTRSFMDRFSGSSSIAPEEVLQLMLTILKDVRWENNDRPINKLPIKEKTNFVSTMIPLCNALSALYTENAGKFLDVRRADVVQEKTAELKQIESEYNQMNDLLEQLKLLNARLEEKKSKLNALQQENPEALRPDIVQEKTAELQQIESEYEQLAKINSLLTQLKPKLCRKRAALPELEKDTYEQARTLKLQLEEDISGMRGILESVAGKDLGDLIAENQALTQQLDFEKANLFAVKESVAALALQYSTAKALLSEKAEEKSRLENAVRELETDLQGIPSQIQDLVARREELLQEISKRKEKDLTPLRVQVQQLETELSSHKSEYSELTARRSDLLSQTEQLKKDIELLRKDCENKESERNQAQQEKQALTTALEELKKELIFLKQRLEELKKELISLKFDVNAAGERIKNYADNVLKPVQEEYDGLLQEEQNMKVQKEDLDKKILLLSNSVKVLTEKCIALQNTVDIKTAEETVLQKKWESLQNLIATVNGNCARLLDEIKELEEEYKGLDPEGTEKRLKAKKLVLEKEILEILKQDCEKLDGDIKNCEKHIPEKRTRFQQLQTDLSLLVSKEQGIQAQIDQIDRQLNPLGQDSFRDRVVKLENRLKLLTAVRNQMSSEFRKLRMHDYWSEDKALNNSLNNIETALQTLQNGMTCYANLWFQHRNDT